MRTRPLVDYARKVLARRFAIASAGGETGNMSPMNVSSIGSYIREQREQAKISIRQLAQAAGVSNPYLSQVERGLRRPSADILQQIAKGLRISAEALYVQAGILDLKEAETAETSVTDAIMADPEITERQKQMLIDIYESFRKEVRTDSAGRAETEADTRAGSDASAAVTKASAEGKVHAWAEASAGAEARSGVRARSSVRARSGAAAHPGAIERDHEGAPTPVAPPGADLVAEAIEESGHDPLAATVAAAEADPWTDRPAEVDPWTNPPAASNR
jgi:transcriptional regulator with XRE-family HTH domain